MQNFHTISYSKIFLILSGLLGFFFALISYPLQLHANQTSISTQAQNVNTDKNAVTTLKDRIQRVSQSIEKKNTAVAYLKNVLQEKSNQKLFSARDIRILKIANQNFKKNILTFRKNQQDYKKFLESSQATDIDEIKAQNHKKSIYKSQQDVYYSFWEVYNLIQESS